MTPFEMIQRVDLLDGQPIPLTRHSPLFTSGDDGSHVWIVHLHRNNAPVEITGSVEAYFRRADGKLVYAPGTASGGTAKVVLPSSAYAVPGPVYGLMRAGMELSTVQTIAKIYFTVQNDIMQSGVMDDGDTLPMLQEILARAQEMEAAVGSFRDVSAIAETLMSGESATATVVKTGISTVFRLGIPKGEQGIQGEQGQQGYPGPKGEPGAGLQLLGSFPTLADLRAAYPAGSPGDAFAVGDDSASDIYLWDVGQFAWVNIGPVAGGSGQVLLPINGVHPGLDGYDVYASDIPTATGGVSVQSVLDSLQVTKLDIENVANNLATTEAGYALDARQGKALNDKLKSGASKEVQSGYLSVTAEASGATSVPITFPTAFTGTPRVVPIIASGSPVNKFIGVSGSSSTGITINVYNNASSAASFTLHWIAIY